jgi:hypothetical protein
MSKFTKARIMIQKTQTEKQMFVAATYIQNNAKTLGLDKVDLQKLSDIGIYRLDQIQRDVIMMQKNSSAKRSR